MRLDKFLKLSRIIKRRTVAKKVSEAENIKVNGKTAKPSLVLKVNDLVSLQYYTKIITIRVTSLTENPSKENSALMYDLISEEKININENPPV
ncbi:MAG: RNA-binding S4 domain-containing protein [Erysipelotrichales bacterium]|nr:RNA-binding S4 domain-containing protein [Erysipelotrichales bacterium]